MCTVIHSLHSTRLDSTRLAAFYFPPTICAQLPASAFNCICERIESIHCINLALRLFTMGVCTRFFSALSVECSRHRHGIAKCNATQRMPARQARHRSQMNSKDINRMELNQIESNRIQSNRIESNRIQCQFLPDADICIRHLIS